jgi:hypothetical protein
MPAIYAPPGRKKARMPANHTVCLVLVGKGAGFEGKVGLRLADDFPDGKARTLPFVEAGEPVPWTKPEEIPYGPAGPVPPLRGLFKDGLLACTAGTARPWRIPGRRATWLSRRRRSISGSGTANVESG